MTVGKPTLRHQGEKTTLPTGESLIGSSPECAIRIEGQGVAPVHAAITVEGDRVLLEDRSPDQETKVNDQRASVLEFEVGQTLRFGEVELLVAREGAGVVLQGTAGRFPMAIGENKVGRVPDCQVQLEDASISRYHATILMLPKKNLLKDLGSTNGSMVDGRAVGVVELSSGDRISLGEVEVSFDMESAAEPTLFEVVVDGHSTVLTPGELTIGRDPECKFSFSDDAGVSRHHAQLVVGADTVRVRDLGSSNGTYVNNSQISGDRALENGDRIGVGSHELLFRAKTPVDPLGKTVLAADLEGLVDKTVLMPKRPTVPPAAQDTAEQGMWAVFDLPAGSSEEQIRQRYQELFSEYQVRLTNAPTPKLKEKYNQRLEELRAAFAELVPDAAGALATDLPSAKPVDTPKAEPAEPVRPPAETSPPPQDVAPSQGAEPAPAKEKQPLPKSALVMAGLGVLALGLAVTMLVLFLGAGKTKADLIVALEEKSQSMVRMQQEIVERQTNLEELEAGKAMLLENRPFKVCNLSTQGEVENLMVGSGIYRR